MNELSQLKAAILEQVHAKGKRQLKQAQQQYRADLAQQEQQLLADRTAVRQRQLQEVRQQAERNAQQTHYQMRQASLAAKQEVLTTLFDDALQAMRDWDATALLAFMQPVLAQFAAEPCSLALGEQTQAKLSEAQLADLLAQFPNLSLADPIRHEAGFVVTVGRIDYNYLFHALVTQVYQAESYQIAHQIFDA